MASAPMTTEERTTRALERGAALADRLTEVAPGVFHVPSQSDPTGLHVVTDLGVLGIGQGFACTCTAAEMGNPCAHRAALVVKRQALERQKLSLRPTVARRHRRHVALV
jgi:hypothetical protein